MSIRTPLAHRSGLLAVTAVLALGAAACTPAEQADTRADADRAAAETGQAADKAGSAIAEEASQLGSAIVAGAGEAAQEVDEATDALARKADEQKAETATDRQGNTPPPAAN